MDKHTHPTRVAWQSPPTTTTTTALPPWQLLCSGKGQRGVGLRAFDWVVK